MTTGGPGIARQVSYPWNDALIERRRKRLEIALGGFFNEDLIHRTIP